jgi:hypothetical protein
MSINTVAAPWYRERFMWVVVGIPLIALLFGTGAALIAFHGADPEVPHEAPLPHAGSNTPPAAPAARP